MDATELQPTRLRILTFDQQTPEPPCSGGFTCPCPRCEQERAQAVARGVRPRKPQPWDGMRRAA